MSWNVNWQHIGKAIGLFWQQNGHTILVLGGTGLTIAGGIKACKDTMKVPAIKAETAERVEAVKAKHLDEKAEHTELRKVYAHAAAQYAGLYATSAALAVGGVTCTLVGHRILTQQHMALAASYAALDTGFKRYRKNVVDRFGEVTDSELRQNLETVTVEKTITDENGKEKTVQEEVKVSQGASDYTRYFDRENTSAASVREDLEEDLFMIRVKTNYLNVKLIAQGYLFLNEVHRELGLKESIAGNHVGWLYDKSLHGEDNYIDLRPQIVKRWNDAHTELMDTIMIDPNVDGDILSRAEKLHLLTA